MSVALSVPAILTPVGCGCAIAIVLVRLSTPERSVPGMASTIWKGYITFGLISIPVRLFAAARTERVSFHMIHGECSTRIKQQLFCPTCERVVERSEIVKGYEIEKNRWVIIDDDEIKKIAPASTDTMDIQQFVKLSDIDPLYF